MQKTEVLELNLLEDNDKLEIEPLNENFRKLDQSNASKIDIPKGVIWMWHGTVDNVPEGWAICDGNNGTPDLRGRFVLGVSDTHSKDSKGGSEKVVLTTAEMPSHSHIEILTCKDYIPKYIMTSSFNNFYNAPIENMPTAVGCMQIESTDNLRTTTVARTFEEGSSTAHENMPPYYTLYYIMKL